MKKLLLLIGLVVLLNGCYTSTSKYRNQGNYFYWTSDGENCIQNIIGSRIKCKYLDKSEIRSVDNSFRLERRASLTREHEIWQWRNRHGNVKTRTLINNNRGPQGNLDTRQARQETLQRQNRGNVATNTRAEMIRRGINPDWGPWNQNQRRRWGRPTHSGPWNQNQQFGSRSSVEVYGPWNQNQTRFRNMRPRQSGLLSNYQ